MKINGVDIASLGARQWNVTPVYSEISNSSEWPEGSLTPLLLAGKTAFKKMKVTVLLKGSNRQEIWTNGGKLVSMLKGPAILELDGFTNYFKGVVTNVGQTEDCIRRFHKATLEFNCYEFGKEVSQSFTNTKEITLLNAGTVETPVIIEIVPTIGKTALIIKGLVRTPYTGELKNIVINRLSSGKRIILDGENGLVTEDGTNKFKDTELFAFPSLLAGQNKIILDQDNINVTIKYKPRYI